MALSAYLAYGLPDASASTVGFPKPKFKLTMGLPVYNPDNLVDRYVLMRRFDMLVQVQGVVSEGHEVLFFDADMKLVAKGISGAGGTLAADLPNLPTVTAIVKDKAGGDIYNSIVRTGLVTLPFDVR